MALCKYCKKAFNFSDNDSEEIINQYCLECNIKGNELRKRFDDTKQFRWGKHRRPALPCEREYNGFTFILLWQGESLICDWIEELFGEVNRKSYEMISKDFLGLRFE